MMVTLGEQKKLVKCSTDSHQQINGFIAVAIAFKHLRDIKNRLTPMTVGSGTNTQYSTQVPSVSIHSIKILLKEWQTNTAKCLLDLIMHQMYSWNNCHGHKTCCKCWCIWTTTQRSCLTRQQGVEKIPSQLWLVWHHHDFKLCHSL